MTSPEILPSWRDGAARTAIVEFVRAVNQPGESFVPAAERIATFDNDGTLWCEKPTYVQAYFVFRRWKEMVEAKPALAEEQPYKALVEGDQAWLSDIYAHAADMIKGATAAYEGVTTGAFEEAVTDFFAAGRHPTLDRAFAEVAYRPMRELITFLETNHFQVYICSGGGRDFVRPVSERLYGIPRERVIGSATTLEYRDGDLYRTAGIEQPIDDGPGKPVHIWTRTGRKPLLAGGNADGDVPMLETARLGLLVRHDDAVREFAYDQGAERALTAAKERGWTVVSMKRDFATIF
jgi:phosphoserine phosphatase